MANNKHLKDEYKQMKFKVGVFQIRNKVNEKIFVGSSINLDAIWNRIKVELKFGGHRNLLLQQEWKEFGEDNFLFEILSEIEQKDGDKVDYNKETKKLEEMFIEELQPFGEKGYNSRKV
jgi:group I intron endonuclease